MPGKRASLEERLWSKIDKRGPDECWPWTGGLDGHGYGHLNRGKRGDGFVRSHRVAYELVVGPIPDGLTLDHTCHNDSGCMLGADCPHRKCCNPKHLEPVTNLVNQQRGTAGLKQKMRTHCPRNHEYTPENTKVKVCNGRAKRFCRECARTYNKRRFS